MVDVTSVVLSGILVLVTMLGMILALVLIGDRYFGGKK